MMYDSAIYMNSGLPSLSPGPARAGISALREKLLHQCQGAEPERHGHRGPICALLHHQAQDPRLGAAQEGLTREDSIKELGEPRKKYWVLFNNSDYFSVHYETNF